MEVRGAEKKETETKRKRNYAKCTGVAANTGAHRRRSKNVGGTRRRKRRVVLMLVSKGKAF
jgi:hypothetical protein